MKQWRAHVNRSYILLGFLRLPGKSDYILPAAKNAGIDEVDEALQMSRFFTPLDYVLDFIAVITGYARSNRKATFLSPPSTSFIFMKKMCDQIEKLCPHEQKSSPVNFKYKTKLLFLVYSQ